MYSLLFVISEKLQTVDGQLATELLERLKVRYSNRRSEDIVSLTLVNFFENLDSLSVVPHYQYKMLTNTTLINKARRIHERLFVDKIIMRILFSQSS